LLSPRRYDRNTVQTRFLILASLIAGMAILIAAAVWFARV
jgi:hypothetical protein